MRSQESIRIAVPPRDLAATISAQSVLRAGWAVALAFLGISVLALIDLWLSHSYGPLVAVPLGALSAVILALAAMIRRPSPATGAAYLAVGTIACFLYVYGLLQTDPGLDANGIYLVNRVTVAMLLIGAVGQRLAGGIVWCTIGWALGTTATAAAQLSLGLEPNPGFGPLVSLAVYIVIIMMFVLIRRSQRRFTPDFSAVEAETARMAGRRELEERAVALLHDTVLNDLAAIANGKDQLDDRARERILRDIAAVSSAQVDPGAEAEKAGVDELRNELLEVMSEFRWRGLTVEVSGGEALSAELDPAAATALVGAVSGCLENIVRHSGSNSAEVFIDATEENLSVMIVDHGRGFDPGAVPENRLGIRRSVITRIESCGGAVRIWSAVGSGTSVLITVPIGVLHV
jgi:signal transduction histidine kinase